jgi:glycosyltransferase involved in cell wall biosynthesis
MSRPHVVLICPEPIRPMQQGVGIRFREMARELAATGGYRVTLFAPAVAIDRVGPERGSGDVAIRACPDDDLQFAQQVLQADARAVVVHGHITDRYLDVVARLETAAPPLVVDLYDPFLVENLQYTRELGDGIYTRDLRVLQRQLEAGDLFLVSSEQQRLFYAGLMMGAGLFDPSMYHADPTLQARFAVAPFGVRAAPGPAPAAATVAAAAPAAERGGWRGVVPGIGAADRIVFFGGIYDWYDPELLLDAIELLDFNRNLDEHFQPKLKILFSENPNPASTPQRLYARVLERARSRGLLGRSVFFVPWFPYEDRAAYLQQADIAVCLHRPSLETDLSLRTRVLDFLHAGLPVIATQGGETANILRASGAGLLVPPGDAAALRDAMLALLAGDTNTDTRRHEMSAAGRSWVTRERPWTSTLAPLLNFCANPQRRPRAAASAFANGAPAVSIDASARPNGASAVSLGKSPGSNGASAVSNGNGHGDADARARVSADAAPEFTVIVPTHNRRRLLAEVLAALDAQIDAPSFETIVVDDGSHDDTRRWLDQQRARNRGVAVQVITQRNRGAASARNAGMRAARGRFVAFLGDDTVPDPHWLNQHAAGHRAAGCDPSLAIVGHVSWHARIRVTPFLRYINEQGKQFGFALIANPRDLPFNFFYTSNASMHREMALSEPFDEGFPYAAWEDTEFAYRLTRRGMRIRYEAAARVAHDHPTSIGRFMRRQERVGYSAVIFHARHPELGQWLGLSPQGPPPLPQTWRERWIQLRVRALDRLGVSSPSEWDEILRLAYLGGLHRGWRELRNGNGAAR